MADFVRGVEQVMTLTNIVTAIVGGVFVGWFMVGRAAADPAWVSPIATARGVAVLVVVYSIAIAWIFYAGQTLAAYIDGDPNWARIISRFVVLVVFDLAMGVATFHRIRVHSERKHTDALNAAHQRTRS